MSRLDAGRRLDVGEDRAIAERDDAIGAGGHFGIVRDDDHRQPLLAVETAKQRDHVLAGAAVEVAGRLVAHEDRRAVDERPGDRHALLLAAGELGGMVVEPVGQADALERLTGTFAPLAGGDPPGIDHRQFDILQRRRPRQEVEVLEYEAEVAIADRGALVLRERHHLPAVEPVAPGTGAVETAECVHERRLPRPRRADEGDILPALDRQRHPLEGLDADAPQVVVLRDRGDLDERHGGSRRRGRRMLAGDAGAQV